MRERCLSCFCNVLSFDSFDIFDSSTVYVNAKITAEWSNERDKTQRRWSLQRKKYGGIFCGTKCAAKYGRVYGGRFKDIASLRTFAKGAFDANEAKSGGLCPICQDTIGYAILYKYKGVRHCSYNCYLKAVDSEAQPCE